jgi:GYF domain 2
MANYFIIGGDGKQYGPITADDLRKWVAEGRLNAQSQAKSESDAEWRPLSAFPEFAEVFGVAPAPTIPPIQGLGVAAGSREAALKKVKAPAVGLMVAAIINLLLVAVGVFRLIFIRPDMQAVNAQLQQLNSELQELNNPQFQELIQKLINLWIHFSVPIGIVDNLFKLVLSVLILIGASKMKSLRSHEFAFAAAIVSVIPCLTPCCSYPLSLVFGIWALVVLGKPEVKLHFS